MKMTTEYYYTHRGKQRKITVKALGWPNGGFDPAKRDRALRGVIEILAAAFEKKANRQQS